MGSFVRSESVLDYPWELYDLRKDWTQSDDVAGQHPDKLKEMQASVLDRSEQVSGLAARRDDGRSVSSRLVRTSPPGRTEFAWTRPMTGMPNGDSPLLLNTSYTFKAEIEVPQGARRA